MASATNETKPAEYYQLLSTKQVAGRLGCSRSMVYKLIYTGELSSVKVGKAVRVRESDLRIYLESLEDIFGCRP